MSLGPARQRSISDENEATQAHVDTEFGDQKSGFCPLHDDKSCRLAFVASRFTK